MRTLLSRIFARKALGRDLRTALVTVVVASAVVAAPSVAARVTDADTVDGKSAVGAGASLTQRRNKLVATDRTGRLPDNIIKKAPDADRLDGLDGSALTPRVLKDGAVQTGVYGVFGGGADSFVGGAETFRSRLPSAIPPGRAAFIAAGTPATSECPGPGRVTAFQWLCVYEEFGGGGTFETISDPGTGSGGAHRDGFYINFACPDTQCFSYGTYAVKAGG